MELNYWIHSFTPKIIKCTQGHNYSKPCDDHIFLVPNSCHPTHNNLRNIPYSASHRIFKICSEPEEYDKSKEEHSTYLKQRGYNGKLIEGSFAKMQENNR